MEVPDGDGGREIFVMKGNVEAAGEKPQNWMPKDSPEMEEESGSKRGWMSKASRSQSQVNTAKWKPFTGEMCFSWRTRGDLWGCFR